VRVRREANSARHLMSARPRQPDRHFIYIRKTIHAPR
jgi:hypothetical protein